jgi:spore coat polysaccharide biosynthesis protein SpsF
LCRELKVKCFRGNEDDVLDRFYGAAQAHGPAEIIVRLTGDCPLHDHRVIDQVIEAFERTPGAAFASNVNPPSFPDGLDVEVFTLAALVQTWREADKPYQRRHVTSYMTENPTLFKLVNVASNHNYSALRWTLDQAADYDFIKAVYQHFYPHRKDFRMQEVIAFLEERPDLVKVNSAFVRDAEYYKEVERETPPPPT